MLAAAMAEDFRALFPITQRLAYLNHSAAGPVSLPVIDAVNAFLRQRAELASEYADESKAMCERTRAKLADFVGATPDEIAFLKNTPDGLNVVANGLEWQAGDNVVVSDLEFPANVYPWMNLRDFGVELKWVKNKAGCIDPAAVIDAIDSRSRVVALSWVEFHGGFRNDLATIGAECRKRGVYLAVDAIQGLGVLRCDVRQLNVDFLCAASQKWMLAPHGVATFYCRREVLEDLRVAFVGQTSVQLGPRYLDYDLKLRPNAGRFEPGYINQVGIAGVEAAVDLFNRVGMQEVEARVLALTGRLMRGLDAHGCEIFGPRADHQRAGVVSFRDPKV